MPGDLNSSPSLLAYLRVHFVAGEKESREGKEGNGKWGRGGKVEE